MSIPAAPERVTVVTVAHNSLAVLPAMLASLPQGARTVIVDNASQDGAALAGLADQHGARLIRNKDNLGFGAACNIGASGTITEFLFFLNPDARLAPDALHALVTAADNHPEASAFNPAITDGRGRPYFKRASVLLPRTDKLAPGWPETDRELPVLTGAAFFVRRTAFEAMGGFDSEIFLYHEDDDLALRLKAGAGPLRFVRAAHVTHDAGNSTVRSPASAAFKAFHMGRSRVYATRKHGLPGAGRKALASALLQLLSPLTLLSARKRAKQTAFLRGILSALKREPAR
ncbi:MAG: glycosyltransferase family 2 protein [Pseudomonadota bacterium]|uniref:glycosyltransferase family 2 protein n=1 Tax=Roseovarius TaxID=74030 RepID=UPI0022A88500|nr:glycosyltransferase family 2 protein [Roseovarius sp. EGI FJ00037]MCZ0812591.1 glycosyltransferase family 2 protein [Roseovarius sp. EGI FJ00037]